MVKCYNVAKVDNYGVELIQLQPPLTIREAREVRVSMKRAFRNTNYVVVNIDTILNGDK